MITITTDVPSPRIHSIYLKAIGAKGENEMPLRWDSGEGQICIVFDVGEKCYVWNQKTNSLVEKVKK